jgi:hypothetical protein
MKKFVAGVVTGFILSCGLALAAEDFGHNGVFWMGLDLSGKRGYLTGYSDAMKISVGKLENLEVAAELFRWKSARKIIGQVSRELRMADVGPEKLMQQLDHLYSDRKYSDLDLGSALQLVNIRTENQSEKPPKAEQNPAKN